MGSRGRQRTPRGCQDPSKAPSDTRQRFRGERFEKEKTERIFFNYGRPPAWVAYALTKRAASTTGHVPGKGKHQRLISRLDRSSSKSRQSLATQLNAALGPDERAKINRLLENIIHHTQL